MTTTVCCCCCSHENFDQIELLFYFSIIRWTDDQLCEVWQRTFLVWKWSWCWSHQVGLNHRTSLAHSAKMKSSLLCCWRRCGIRWWHECGKIIGVDDVVVEIWRWCCHDWCVRPTFMWVDFFLSHVAIKITGGFATTLRIGPEHFQHPFPISLVHTVGF